MLNVIRSEAYKLRHRAYPYVFLGALCALGLLAIALFAWINHESNGTAFRFEETLILVITVLPLGVYLTPAFMDMVFSDEYRHLTMKNTVSFGVPRVSVYLGKLIVEWLAAVGCLLVFFVLLLGSAYLLLGLREPGTEQELVRSLGMQLLGALPLWTGALCVINMLAFQFKNSTLYTIGFVVLFSVFSELLRVLGALISPVFMTVRSWMIMPQFDMLKGQMTPTASQVGKCWAVGMGFALVSTVVGILLFKRKEIR